MRGRVGALTAALSVTTGAVLPALLVGTLGERITSGLGLGEAGLGLSLAAFFGTSALLAPVAGGLADRIGWPAAIRRGGLTVGLGLVLVATAGGSVPGLVAGLAVGGVGMATAMPAGSRAVAVALPADRQGLLFGVKQAAIPLAGLLAGAAVPAVALTVGWRWSFAAALPLPLLAVVLAGRVTGPSRDGRRGGPGAPPPRAYRLLAAGAAAAAAALASMSTFAVVTAVDAGLAEGGAGLLVALASGLGLAVRVVAGWLADRRGSDGLVAVATMLAVGAGGLALVGVGTSATVVVGTLVAYAVGWGWPGLFYLGAVVHHPASPGAATGTVQAGLSGGSAVGPPLFGLVAGGVGLTAAWGTAAAAMLLGGVLVGVGRRRLGALPRRGGRILRAARTADGPDPARPGVRDRPDYPGPSPEDEEPAG